MNDSQDEEQNYGQEPEYIDIEDWDYEKLPWHPELTQEQIVYGLEKDIYEPEGQEYEQFLMELGLGPVKEVDKPIPAPPTLIPIPPKHPTIPGGTHTSGSSYTGGGDGPQGDIKVVGGTHTSGSSYTGGGDYPQGDIKVVGGTHTGGSSYTGGEEPQEDPEFIDEMSPSEESDEEIYTVVRVDKNFKDRLSLWLIAAAFLIMSTRGIDIPDEKVAVTTTESSHVVKDERLQYSIIEYIREYGYDDQIVENIIYKFASNYGFNIGDVMDLGMGSKAYYYGNLTGSSITLDGKQTITGFCLYSTSEENVKYEYSFYEDRDLDGTPDRTNVDDFTSKTNVSINDFLSKLNTKDYNLEDIRFSLHFENKGWVDFSDIINVTEGKQNINVQKLVEICKEGATYEGILEDPNSDYITIMSADGSQVQIPIVDNENQLLSDGTHVLGSDGREYVITNLETVPETSIETITTTEYDEGDGKLKWGILDCELVAGLAPLVAGVGFAIASKLRNDEYAKNPDFFEFENKRDYENFKRDFELARKERNKKSKFAGTLKRIFYGETLHISKDLSEGQIKQLYRTISNTHNADYSYDPSHEIRFMDGKIYAVFSDGGALNITSLVGDIGKENPKNGEGLLTDEVVDKYESR